MSHKGDRLERTEPELPEGELDDALKRFFERLQGWCAERGWSAISVGYKYQALCEGNAWSAKAKAPNGKTFEAHALRQELVLNDLGRFMPIIADSRS